MSYYKVLERMTNVISSKTLAHIQHVLGQHPLVYHSARSIWYGANNVYDLIAYKGRQKRLSLPAASVDEVLTRHDVQPWFRHIFHDRATRWDVWQSGFWIAEYVPRNARVLECGCGVGFNLLWLATQGFERLYGFDIDPKATAAGTEIGERTGLPIQLWVGDGLQPPALLQRPYDLILNLNWILYIPEFDPGTYIDNYLPYLAPGGFFVVDAIDSAYNQVPNHQYHSSDWNLPLEQRRPSEFCFRITRDEVQQLAKERGLTVAAVLSRQQTIPKHVFVLQKS